MNCCFFKQVPLYLGKEALMHLMEINHIAHEEKVAAVLVHKMKFIKEKS